MEAKQHTRRLGQDTVDIMVLHFLSQPRVNDVETRVTKRVHKPMLKVIVTQAVLMWLKTV